MVSILERRLLVVSGKGGTGKSTVAAAIGVLAAREGRRVLLCEMDAKGTLAASFEHGPLGFVPVEVAPGVHAMAMNTEDSLREYLRLYTRIPVLARLGVLSRTFDFVADAAPGVKELLSLGKLCHEVKQSTYDLVVVDGVATGHVIAQLDAPHAVAELVAAGPIREQTRWMQALLDDPAVTGVVLVTTPEEMPVVETLELVERIRAATSVDVAAVIANRVLPEWFGRAERALFERIVGSDAMPRITERLGSDVGTVFTGTRLAVEMRRNAVAQLEVLRSRLPARIDTINLPELFVHRGPRGVVESLADALGEELL